MFAKNGSNPNYRAGRHSVAVYHAVRGGSSVESVSDIAECDHLNESYRAILSRGNVS